MAEKRNKRKRCCEGMMWIPLAAGALALVLLFAVITQRDLYKMHAAADETIGFVRSCCEKYNNYRLGVQTAELQSVLDKVRAFSQYLTAHGATDTDTMQTYLREQELDGVLVLDSTLMPTVSASQSGANAYSAWRDVLEDENVSSILHNPSKSFLQTEEIDGTVYDYAVTARPNGAGLILCCSRSKLVHPDEAEFSMNTLLSGYTLRLDGVAVVTDGENVLCSNEPAMQNRRVDELQIMAEGENLRSEDGITTIRHAGEKWYGFQSKYKSWNIYVYFPIHGIYAGRSTVMAYGIILYVLFWLLYLMLRHRTMQDNLHYMERQYQLTNAIGSAYAGGVHLQLDTDTWEPINLPARLVPLLREGTPATTMLYMLIERRIAAPYREIMHRFADLRTMADRLDGKNSLGCDYENVDGDWYYTLLVPQKRDAAGRVTSAALLIRDVTEEKKRELNYQEQLRLTAEQAERANIAKTDFLRRMSHDIRTPINGIRGMVEIGRHYAGDEQKQEECRQKIMDASGFLLDLVNDVLDMNKLESGEIKLDSRPFDLHEVLHETFELMNQQAREAGVVCTFTPPAITHSRLIGSPLHLRQIWQNVMTNAVKYNKPGGTVHVSCKETDVNGNKAVFVFTCADTGIGMSEEFQKHIFEPFAQENSAARTNYKGTGLGMSIVKELVEHMGGSITFTSRQGVGTTFVLTVPMEIDLSVPAVDTAPQTAENTSIKGVRVLVAEDNALNMEITQFLLEDNGAVVTGVWNGQEAVEAFAASQPGDFDIILLDVMMPVMNGLDAARAIRALERPDAKTIPMLAMTANAFADDVERSLEAGINEHLTKPIESDKVIKTIAKYVHKRR